MISTSSCLSNKKVVVTGGAGFIGSHLVKLLVEKGYDILVYDDLSNGSGKKNLPIDTKIIKGNILNFSKLKSCFKNATIVFNLAVLPLAMSFDNPDRVVQINDYGTYLVSKACAELKIKLVHVSSSEAYGTAKYSTMKETHPLLPTTIYASSKAASEAYVRAFEQSNGLNFVIVRPFNSYGEFMREDGYGAAIPKFYKRISKNKPPIIFGSGNQTRDLTYVADTVNGIYLASQEPLAEGGTFNIAQGQEVKINHLAKLMIKEYSRITRNNLDLELEFQDPRPGDVKRHLGDISLSRKILGYKPKISLRDGIIKYIKWKLGQRNNSI